MRKRILVLNGQYAPGYKGGGPIQSCINMIENLYEQFDFFVICSDRDYKDSMPYNNVKINQWNNVGHAKVYYLGNEYQSFIGLQKVINRIDFDVLYLNGFFSPVFTIKPLILKWLHIINPQKVVLTPRGDFTGGCENKKIKKYIYIFIVKKIGLYRNLIWQATSDIEARDIRKKFSNAVIYTIPNFPAKYIEKKNHVTKIPGELKLVFVSRIFPKKNLKYALEVLRNIPKGDILFDIYGPMEDKNYWSECEKVIKSMPNNITVKYCGEIEHKDIPNIFGKYHAFFFPTLGENYGHVIVEAMMNNCICILSKGVTPWDDYIESLDIGAELDNPMKFGEIIEELVNMNQSDFDALIRINSEYVAKKTDSTKYLELYEKMFKDDEEDSTR